MRCKNAVYPVLNSLRSEMEFNTKGPSSVKLSEMQKNVKTSEICLYAPLLFTNTYFP